MGEELEAVYGPTSADVEKCVAAFRGATTHFKLKEGVFHYENGDKATYQHRVIADPKRQGRYETAILYHSGYNGNALSEKWDVPNLCNNLFLAVQELSKDGYEPANDIVIHTMSHLGSGSLKGRVHLVGEMIECVNQSLQRLPSVENYGLYGSSMGVDFLLKGVPLFENGRRRGLPIRGVFGVSSALNGFDEDKFFDLREKMGIIQKAAYGLGRVVNVDGYRISKDFEDDAIQNLMNGYQRRFSGLNVRLLHSEHDSVVPYVDALGKAESFLGRRVEFVKMDFAEDGVQAHLARTPENLVFIREQTKEWLVKVCEGQRALKPRV